MVDPPMPASPASRPCCVIGARPDVAAIDYALRAGVGLETLRKAHPTASRSALSRHRARCLGVDVDELAKAKTVAPATPTPAQEVEEALRGGFEGTRAAASPVTSHTSLPSADARATPPSDPKSASTHQERVLYVADLIAQGRWLGRPTARALAEVWRVERTTVQDYARDAALLCQYDHGEIEQHRQEALGHWTEIRRRALEEGDLKAASAAQSGYDRAAGIVQPGGATVQVNVQQFFQQPGVSEVMIGLRTLVGLLLTDQRMALEDRIPALDRWLLAVQAQDAAAVQDPGKWLAAEVEFVETTEAMR